MEMESKTGTVKPWSSWKSPIGLGFFFITTALALAIVLYTFLNLFVSIDEALHPAASQGMSAQELQQLEQSAPSDTGTTGQ